ncbi:hypothetical protein GDO81_021560 [Engystomops pustulosus]|uniref:Uncharacterized protein n=1 Tax=Engystomops pustulosus TaxID=76066 RepID=A0AAV6YQ24_ENGPU|nr:hypothetical protein GDO81_021560 [Engystomops pustulosus]
MLSNGCGSVRSFLDCESKASFTWKNVNLASVSLGTVSGKFSGFGTRCTLSRQSSYSARSGRSVLVSFCTKLLRSCPSTFSGIPLSLTLLRLLRSS